jgi:hypothetical protein
MGLANIRNNVARYLTNMPGWKTDRKIIVIESDDWGSIRMPSREVYLTCLKAGYAVDKNPYEKYDSLLSQTDLELLFELLTRFRDKNDNCPIITANCVVANPNFDKIHNDRFEQYHYELITDTFQNYSKHSGNFDLWQQGIQKKIFFPQYHAREHVNVSHFMDSLKNSDPDVHFGFNNRMVGTIPRGPLANGNNYVDVLSYTSIEDKTDKLGIFLEGLDLFEGLFGFRSESVIPPNYTWSPDFNGALQEKGVKIFQGLRKFREPMVDGESKFHTTYLGMKNDFDQAYLVRNAWFEPSLFTLGIKNPVDRCLSDISIAFKMRKPAIITSHRLNYAGFIEERNRDRTLKMLDTLFRAALKKWPDIEFMTSSQLGRVILSEGT